MARIIGTAPLKPTQDINNFSLNLNLFPSFRNGNKERKTLAGRATKNKKAESKSPGTITWKILEGKTNKPSVINIAIWLNTAKPSNKRTVLFL